MITKPEKEEYHEFYGTYVNLVIEEDDVVDFMKSQRETVVSFFESLSSGKLNYAYAEGKWTILELLRHMIDTERVLGYRTLCIARNDKTSLPGFEENDYVEYANDDNNNLQDLVTEFIQVRNSNISMIKNFAIDILERKGNVNGGPWTPRAGVFIIAGHVQHHLTVIKERYI